MFGKEATIFGIFFVVVQESSTEGDSERGHMRFRISFSFIEWEPEFSHFLNLNIGYLFSERCSLSFLYKAIDLRGRTDSIVDVRLNSSQSSCVLSHGLMKLFNLIAAVMSFEKIAFICSDMIVIWWLGSRYFLSHFHQIRLMVPSFIFWRNGSECEVFRPMVCGFCGFSTLSTSSEHQGWGPVRSVPSVLCPCD